MYLKDKHAVAPSEPWSVRGGATLSAVTTWSSVHLNRGGEAGSRQDSSQLLDGIDAAGARALCSFIKKKEGISIKSLKKALATMKYFLWKH